MSLQKQSILFINGLDKAGIEINRKMLSELAIANPEAFTSLVKIAKDALDGKVTKPAKKETATKAEPKKAEAKKEEKKDYSKMTLAELKAVAKEQGVKGYSTMKKDELLKSVK